AHQAQFDPKENFLLEIISLALDTNADIRSTL
ncbi:hypothetical protein LCGC14_2141380, partial [marine sediment metagenome]